MTNAAKAKKPALHLLSGAAISPESVIALFEKLQGRKATPKEIAEIRRELAK